MVGVPRSKACLTCRNRKKGCDLGRPSCGQCTLLEIDCGGYAKDLVFRNTSRQSFAYKASTVTLPDALARSAYEDRCLELFWSAYLPNGQIRSSNAEQDTLRGWTNAIQALYSTDDTLRKAVLALCLASSGRQKSEKWMTEAGWTLYGSALQDMSVAVKKQSTARGDSILTAARIFSLYEAMYGADSKNSLMQFKSWTVHISGELAILTARGPAQFMEGHAYSLFIHGRLHLTVAAIKARKKTVLSELKWKTIPWTHHAKSTKDRLLDILVEIPTILEEYDALRGCDGTDVNGCERRKLINKCWVYDEHLTGWYRRLTLGQASKPINKDDSIMISNMDLGSAHLLTLFWATCVILYNVMNEVAMPDVQLPEPTNIKRFCQKIIRTVPIFFHSSVGAFRAYLVTFPSFVVMTHLHVFGPEERLVERKLLEDCFTRPEGMMMGKFLKSVELEALRQ